MFLNLQALGVNAVSTTANSIKKTYTDLYFYGESSLSNISLLNKNHLQSSNANIDLSENQVQYINSNDGNALLITLNKLNVKAIKQESITNAFNGLSFEYNTVENGVDVEITDNYVLEKQQSWITGTNMMLANFKTDNGMTILEAGNFSSSYPITHWRILRRIYKETEPKNVYTELTSFTNNLTTKYYDYLSRSGIKYEYALQPISNGINLNYISEVSIVEFFGWKLESKEKYISGTSLTSFSFDMEIETGNINTVTDITKLNNYSKYPLISRSLVEYEEGEITCMPYEIVSNNISVNNNILNTLKSFIHDGKTKILRNGSGRAWEVYTMDFNYKYNDKVTHDVVDNENNQPFTVSWKWCQVGEVLG